VSLDVARLAVNTRHPASIPSPYAYICIHTLRQSGSPADRSERQSELKEGETEAEDFLQVPVVFIGQGLTIARQSFTVQPHIELRCFFVLPRCAIHKQFLHASYRLC